MRKSSLLHTISHIATTTCLILLLGSCHKKSGADWKKTSYTIYTPVLKAKSEVLAAINGDAALPVKNAGKIYIKDNYIYLNEVDKGIHIIDNNDPSHPKQVAFLNIPGNLDIAVKDHILYADMYADLLAIDISNPKKVSITNRLSNFFTSRMYFNNTTVEDGFVAIDWIKKDTIVSGDNGFIPDCINCLLFADVASAPGAKSNGTAGSMASMILMNDYLYAITERHSLGVVNISDAATPVFKSNVYAGYDLETIYPFDNKLFMGSAIGLFMYDMSDPENPSPLGTFSHGRACDPVVTDGRYAYVTLHAGTSCGGDANELNVIDIKDLMKPVLTKAYPLTKPTGLCKDGDLLFICDDVSGVRVYDAADPSGLKLLQQISSKEPYDVIAGNNHVLVVAKDGLYQYDYSNINQIRQLSFFALK